MFKKILVANRGEIALRVIRACREMGIPTVVVYSEADAETLPVMVADESICIGPPQADKSYLNPVALLSAARISGCDALHPGYGFLSENAEFAEMCLAAGITFIGPSPECLALSADKAQSRALAKSAGVPILAGSEDTLPDISAARVSAKEIGFPLILKATGGGGGRGMKVVHSADALGEVFDNARQEAESAFGDGRVYLERYIPAPRHIEVQIMADAEGKVVHLYERECSVQRRHQKIIEEAPAPGLTEEGRTQITGWAIDIAKACNYTTVGTVEFLQDAEGRCYFIEMNSRIQVEHPVTELITGMDLVKEQILLAAGGLIEIDQEDIKLNGHAIECRICTEDPATCLPAGGTITGDHAPGGPGIRIDSAVYEGLTIPPYYDSLIIKLLAHGCDRNEALLRSERALSEFLVDGVPTNIPLLQRILETSDFKEGHIDTHFLNSLLCREAA